MNAAPDHERWADAAAAYLLYALEESEAAQFETHLAQCPDCRSEVEFLKMAADALPVATVQIDPPPALKSRIMAIVEREAELLRAAGPEADRPPAPEKVRGGRWSWWPSMTLRPAAALASVLVLLAGGAIVGSALQARDDAPDRVLRASAEISGVSAKLEVRDSHGRLAVENLPAPPEGRVYQVWLQRAGEAPEPTNALFSPRGDGTSSVDVPGRLDGIDKVLVTDEPRGGSPVPTRTPVITVALS